MSRKDFQLIAAVIRETRNIEATSRTLYAEAFATALAATHPRFDRARFLAACESESAAMDDHALAIELLKAFRDGTLEDHDWLTVEELIEASEAV